MEQVLSTYELAYRIIQCCTLSSSQSLLQVSSSLNRLKHDEHLWRTKVQLEFGLTKFKPTTISFYQQYFTIQRVTSYEMAIKDNRCDQLRWLRRQEFISAYDVSMCAIKHDQPDVLQWLFVTERYEHPCHLWCRTLTIGPKVLHYIIGLAFHKKPRKSKESLLTLRQLFISGQLPEDFDVQMEAHGYDDVATWYRAEIVDREQLAIVHARRQEQFLHLGIRYQV